MIKNKENIKKLVNELSSELMDSVDGTLNDKFEIQFNEEKNKIECIVKYQKNKALSEKTIGTTIDYNSVVGDKYELLQDDFIFPYGEDGPKLYRIRALKDFGDVNKGDLGGYVEGEHNLSNYGDCWIYDNSCVFEGSFIDDSAKVKEDSLISSAAVLVGNSIVKGGSMVRSQAYIGDNVVIDNCVAIFHRAYIFGNSVIKDDKDILYFSQDIYPSDQLISYVPESDTWTYPISVFNPKAFTTDAFIECIMEDQFNVVDKEYLLNLIELGKKIRNNRFPKYNSSEERTLTKEYIVLEDTYISTSNIGDGNIKVEDIYARSNGASNGCRVTNFLLSDNRFTTKTRGDIVVNRIEGNTVSELYRLFLYNEHTGECSTFDVKTERLTYYDGFRWCCDKIERLYNEFLTKNHGSIQGVKRFEGSILVGMCKVKVDGSDMYSIRVSEDTRLIFKLKNGSDLIL